ncbi:MAG: DUF2971 domain-containing protein [Bacteroidota bacterium]|nr:DUF2971 domain-containing protein [Bacteroidota bacterium]
MKVYKYRSGNEYLDRDLKSIVENYFYAPIAENLNDPCETLVYADKIRHQTKLFTTLFGEKVKLDDFHNVLDGFIKNKQKLGIYSLSKTYSDELLWAHYANNHTGFCIEYDFETLLEQVTFCNFYPLNVEYSKEPPQIELNDVYTKDDKQIFKKIAGTKSTRWSYEEELRIITDKSGEQDYNFSAVTAIYFGYRMPEKDKDKIMSALKGRNISYYQITLKEKSYSFIREKVVDTYLESEQYLFKYYRKQNSKNTDIIDYEIIEKKYNRAINKINLTIKLDSKLSETELEDLGNQLKSKLYRRTEIVYIFYHLKQIKKHNTAWAITHFLPKEKTIEILGLKLEEEIKFKNKINKESREVLGHWMDETFLNSLLTLFEENGKTYLETLYRDESKLIKEQIVSKVKGGIKYEDIDNQHGEYIIIDQKGVLKYYSENGLFNEIEKIKP